MSILGNPVCLPIGGKAAKGSRMFLGVTLPRSIYYEQAAEWLKIKDNVKADIAETQWDGQVVCGNSLWEIYGNNAYSYSLETGDLLDTVQFEGVTGKHLNAITTDGTNRIWFARYDNNSATANNYSTGSVNQGWVSLAGTLHLYEFDISSKSIKSLTNDTQLTFSHANPELGRHGYANAQLIRINNCRIKIFGYSSKSQKLYFSGCSSNATVSYKYYTTSTGSGSGNSSSNIEVNASDLFEYDLVANKFKKLSNYPQTDGYASLYFYEDGDYIYVGNGYWHNDKQKEISRYSISSDTWESVTSNFEGYTIGSFSYITLGDKMLQISQTATGVFDPKTGNLEPMAVPVIPPDNTVMYPGFQAYSNNILYLVNSQGVYKCPFFSSIPDDAPIVCKIYKGQKYHTLEPFEIPNKIKLLRTQQIAEQDIEIKMYEYASEGGQTIFIEDIGE